MADEEVREEEVEIEKLPPKEVSEEREIAEDVDEICHDKDEEVVEVSRT